MNINPLDFNYIDGLNTYPIQDYIDASITSNITSNIITCNINIGGNQTLNNSLYYLNSNLYLNNNAPFGNIYFKTSYNYPNSNNIGVKIDFSGKLQVYHNYNILQPTLGEGYYDVESEILQLKADGINTDVQLTALEAGAIYLQSEIDDLLVAINLLEVQLNSLIQNIYFSDTYNQLRNVTLLTDYSQYAAQYATLINNIATQANAAYVNSFTIGAATAVGFGIAGAALSATASYFYYQRASNAVFSNVNFSNAQKTIVYNNNSNKEITTYNNYYTSSCNLSINQGFINSNITTQQLIPKLKSNEITLNNKAITKFSLDNLDDWIKTTYGIYYDITNGTLAINSTPNLTDFFRVGGQTTIQGDLISETKMKVNSTSVGTPNFGVNGGAGDKLIFKEGSVVLQPYSLGLNTNELWYSTPSSATHKFYINASPITTISSTGLTTTGFINATTNIQENGTNLTAKYLQLSGGTLIGNLNISLANPILTIKGTLESQKSIIYLSTPFNSSCALKTAIIAEGISNWSRSKLHFCLNNTGDGTPVPSPDWNNIAYNATIADARMTILPNGNVGIGITSPSSRIHISEITGSSASSSTGSLIIDHENNGGQSSIVFRSKVNRGSDYGYISYIDTVLSTSYNYFNVDAGATESAALILGSENDSTSSVGSGGPDSVIISPAGNIALTPRNNITYISGNVGIGITNPSQKLHIDTGCLYITGNISNPGNNTSASLWNQANVGPTFSGYQFVVQTNGTTERLRIDASGNVGIGITNPSQKLHINGDTTINGKFIVGNNNSYPDFQLGSANGYNIAIATTAGAFSSSAQAGDMVIRSIETKRLILQSNGGGGAGIIIDSANNTTISGSLSGANNVCKRAIFSFTPSGAIVGGLGFRYTYSINVENYMTNTLYGPSGNQQYVFRIHIWTTSADFGDSINNVESMTYLVYLANWGGGPKIRVYPLANSSNGSLISVSTYNTIYYNGWNGTGGASQKYCVIENISSY